MSFMTHDEFTRLVDARLQQRAEGARHERLERKRCPGCGEIVYRDSFTDEEYTVYRGGSGRLAHPVLPECKA